MAKILPISSLSNPSHRLIACEIYLLATDQRDATVCEDAALTEFQAQRFMNLISSKEFRSSKRINCHDADALCERVSGYGEACSFTPEQFLSFASHLRGLRWSLPKKGSCFDTEPLAAGRGIQPRLEAKINPEAVLDGSLCEPFIVTEDDPCPQVRQQAALMIAEIINEHKSEADTRIPVPACPYIKMVNSNIIIAQPGPEGGDVSVLTIYHTRGAFYSGPGAGPGGNSVFASPPIAQLETLYALLANTCGVE